MKCSILTQLFGVVALLLTLGTAGLAGTGSSDLVFDLAPSSTTGVINFVTSEEIQEERRGGQTRLIFIANGLTSTDRRAEAKVTLDDSFWLDPQPHRVWKLSRRGGAWTNCWHLNRRTPSGIVALIGCVRRDLSGTSRPVRWSFEGALVVPYLFDTVSQRFKLSLDRGAVIPSPRALPADQPITGLRVLMPLPLLSYSTNEARDRVRANGARVVTSGKVDVLLLPDWADYCAFDRLSRPREVTKWLRAGTPVVWERCIGDRHGELYHGLAVE